MKTIPTVIHVYNFNIADPAQNAEWLKLRDSLKSMGLKCFKSCGGGSHRLGWVPDTGMTVNLETDFLWKNQWNTAAIAGVSENGWRVFDWAMDYRPNNNPNIKRGHWLEQTDAMREIRHNTVKCGYCGHAEPYDPARRFCTKCAGSEYLKPKDFPLVRFRRVDGTGYPSENDYPPLTTEELAAYEPIYAAAQAAAKKSRVEKARANLISATEKKIRDAQTERDGKLWLLDHGEEVQNVIFYDHTGRFAFGWRDALTEDEKSHLLDVLREFPYDYDIVSQKG